MGQTRKSDNFERTESGLIYLNSLVEWKGIPGFDLGNIKGVLGYLGNPQDRIKTVIIGGTNGKGSTSAAIASIAGAAGYKAGLNISPHLSRLNERVVIDGYPVEDEVLAEAALRLKEACEGTGIKLSFHEGITVIAFLVFESEGVDWTILEVGLGGRLDAANVVKNPMVSVIVTVDYDHQHILGDTLAQIAFEKAGIIRENGTVVSGMLSKEASEVVCDRALSMNARHLSANRDFTCSKDGDLIKYKSDRGELVYKPSLNGRHQLDNMAVAITTGLELGFSLEECKNGVETVFWPGRIEHAKCGNSSVLIDCAHNPAGVDSLVSYLKSRDLKDLRLGFGVLDTKNWEGMIEKLIPYVKEWNLLQPYGPRSLDPDELAGFLSGIGINSRVYGCDYSRFIADISEEDRGDVLLTGSIYLIGRLRSMIIGQERPVWQRRKRVVSKA